MRFFLSKIGPLDKLGVVRQRGEANSKKVRGKVGEKEKSRWGEMIGEKSLEFVYSRGMLFCSCC